MYSVHHDDDTRNWLYSTKYWFHHGNDIQDAQLCEMYRMYCYIQKNELHDVQDALTVVVLALDAQCARCHCMVVLVCFMCMLDITVVQGVQLH